MKKRWLAAIVACSLSVGSFATYSATEWLWPDQKASVETGESLVTSIKDFEKVAQAYHLIKTSYVQKIPHEQLIAGAIQGMLGSLKDPYSVYMDKPASEIFNDSLDSSFEGIGAQIAIEEGRLVIVSPIKNTPAEKAGLKARDQITKIDGESVEGLDLHEASSKIRGKKGTTVELEIKRSNMAQPIQYSIERGEVPILTVFSDVKKEGDKQIGYIEITSFAEGTARDFKTELTLLEEEGIDGLVIDVRKNPGGMLSSAQGILEQLVTSKKPYVQIAEKNGNKEPFYSGLKKKKPYPINVLIDEGSASASEILAGALNEVEGYSLVGVKTFGKGTVQQAYPLEDGSNIKLTMFKWLTPNGTWIHGKGINPTVEVKQPAIFHTSKLSLEEPLVRDMNNEQVKAMQEVLASLGYGPGRNDGYFDEQTERAVKAFQSLQKLPVTGKVDEETSIRMEEEIEEAIQDEKNDLQLKVALKII